VPERKKRKSKPKAGERKRAASDGSSVRLDAAWREWLELNRSRGCADEELYRILCDNGFDPDDVSCEMGGFEPRRTLAVPPRPVAAAAYATAAGPPRARYHRLAQCRITDPVRSPGAHRVETPCAQLYLLEDFMTPDECARLVSLVDERLHPSTTTTGEPEYRTSRTCYLSHVDDDFVRDVDERIAHTLGIGLAYSEEIQAQRYDVGQEFKRHTDYFEPGTVEWDEHTRERGQRSWTFMVYLCDTERGGGTRFVHLERTFYPKTGRAVVWNNLYPSGIPNPDTEHHGMPVEAGRKVIITKWFRDRPQSGRVVDS